MNTIIQSKFLRSTIHLLLVAVLTFNPAGVSFAQFSDDSALYPETALETPTKTLEEAEEQPPLEEVIPQTETQAIFEEAPLEEPTEEEEQVTVGEPNELERYDFDRAINSLQDDVATAVILEDITEDNLQDLVDLDFEVGIIILHGEIVLFTSGNEDEILVQEPVIDLINKASFVAHTHPAAESPEPSNYDLAYAVDDPEEEYVVSSKGVYSYNSSGVLNAGIPSDYSIFVEKLYEVLVLDQESERYDSVQARGDLNNFIYQQDLFNYEEERDAELFRLAGGPLDPVGGLSTNDVTQFAGIPLALQTGGSHAASSVSYDSGSEVTLSYDFSGSAGFAGVTYEPSSPANYSAATNLVFGLEGTVGDSIQLEVFDGTNTETVVLQGVTGTEQFWQIPFATNLPTINKSNVVRINFVVNDGLVGAESGSIKIRAYEYSAPVTAGVDTVNSLQNDPLPVTFGAGVTGSSFDPATGTATLDYDVTAGSAGISFGQVGPQDYSSVNELVIGVKENPAPAADSRLRVEIKDSSGNAMNYIVSGIDGTDQTFSLDLNLLNGGDVDRSDITEVIFITDNTLATENTGQLVINIKNFSMPLANDGSLTAADVISLIGTGNNPYVQFVEGGLGGPTQSHLSTADDVVRLEYDVSGGGFTGVSFRAETQDFSALPNDELIIGLQDDTVGSQKIKVELVDTDGDRYAYTLDDVTSTEKFFKLDLTQLPADVDLSSIAKLNIIKSAGLAAGPMQGDLYIRLKDHLPRMRRSSVYNSTDRTDFSAFSPTVSRIANAGNDSWIHQNNAESVSLYYDVSNPGDYAGIRMDMTDADISASTLVFGLQAETGALTSRIKVRIEDTSGNSDEIILFGVKQDKWTYFEVPQAIYGSSVDFTHIKFIDFVADNESINGPTSGRIALRTLGLSTDNQHLKPNKALNSSDLTDWASQLTAENISRVSSPGNSSYVHQYSTSRFGLFYDVTTPDSYAGGSLLFDDGDISGSDPIVFGFQGESGISSIKLEVVDGDGDSDYVILNNIKSDSWAYFSINQSLFDAGIDFTNIDRINFIVDGSLVPAAQSGRLLVRTESLWIRPDRMPAKVNSSALTDFSAFSPVPEKIASAGNSSYVHQYTSSQAGLFYDVSAGGSYAGTSLNFTDADLSAQDPFVFGLKGESGITSVKIEIIDTANDKVSFYLNNIKPDKWTYFSIDHNLFDITVDPAHIERINFIIDATTVPAAEQGRLLLRTNGMSTSVPCLLPKNLSSSSLTDFSASLPVPERISSNNQSWLRQWNASSAGIMYDVTQASSYAGVSLNFTDADLSASDPLVFALKGGDGLTSAKVEVVDTDGDMTYVILNQITADDWTYFSIDQSLYGGDVDFTKVERINFVVDGNLVPAALTGRLAVRADGYDFTANYVSSASLDAGDVTALPDNSISQSPIATQISSGFPAADNFQQANEQQVSVDFDVSAGGSWSGINFSFDDNSTSGTVETADFSGITDLVLGVSASTGFSRLKVEFVDSAASKETIYLNNVTDTETFFSIPLSVLSAGLRADIRNINIILDGTLAGQTTGTLSVRTDGLFYNVPIDGTAYVQGDITALPADAVLTTGENDAGADNSSITATQTSPRDFSFDYVLGDGTDFVFSTLTFPSPQDLGSSLILAAKGPSGSVLQVDVKDSGARTATYYLNLVGVGAGDIRNYTLDLAASHVPAGFDISQIEEIVFVATPSRMGVSGTVTIETNGLDYTADVTGIAYSQGDITLLPGTPVLGSGENDAGTQNSSINQSQTSTQDFNFNYVLGDVADFVFSTINFSSPQDLGSSVTFALNGPAGGKLKAEVKDNTGKIADFYINLTGSLQNYTLDLSGDNIPAGFDTSNISQIVFVAEPAKMGSAGTVIIETNGLQFGTDINGDPYDQPSLSTLPGFPTLGDGKNDADADSVITQTQTSPRDFSFDYTITDAEDFVFSTVNFSSPQDLGNSVTLGVNGPNATQLKVEVKDDGGRTATVNLNLTGSLMNYTIPLTGANVPVGFDNTNITQIVFVADQANMGTGPDTVTFETSGLAYTSSVSPDAYDQGLHTALPGNPTLNSGENDGGAQNTDITQTQTSSRDFSFDYTVTDSGDFVFSTINWGYFDGGGAFVGTAQDFSATNAITLAANGPDAQNLKVEVKDDQERTAMFLLDLDGALSNYTLDLTGDNIPTGFDTSNIAQIVFVVDQPNVATAPDTIAIQTDGIAFSTDVTGAAYDQPSLTSLPGNPNLGDGINDADLDATFTQTQTSSSDFSFTYNLPDAGDFAYSTIGWGYFNGGGFVGLPQDFSATDAITIAARGPAGSRLKAEVKDSAGRVAIFYLDIVGPADPADKRNYTLDLTGNNVPTGFDTSNIAMIVLVVEPSEMGTAGTVWVETVGLNYQQTVNGAAYDAGALSTLPSAPSLNSGENDDGTQNTSITQLQTSPTQYYFDYTIGNEPTDVNDFVFSYMTFAPSVDVGTSLTLAANGPNGNLLKVEVKDDLGGVATFYLNLTGALQNYTLDLSAAGVDTSRVDEIVVVADRTNMGTGPSTVNLEINGLLPAFIPNGALGAGDVTTLPLNDHVTPEGPEARLVFGADETGDNTFNQTADGKSTSVDYDITAASPGYSGVTLNYNRLWSNTQADFSGIGNLVVGVSGASGGTSRIKVEFEDDAGAKEAIYLSGVTDTVQYYEIDMSILSAGIRDSIRYISFIVERDQVPGGGQTDTLTIYTDGLYFSGQLLNDPSLTSADVSTLPATPFSTLTGGTQGDSAFVQEGTDAIEILYDTSTGGSYAGTTISFDDFGTGGVETQDLSGQELIFGASNAAGGSVKLEFIDVNGDVDSVYLGALGATEKYYRVDLTGFGTIDTTQVRYINIVAEDAFTPDDRGVIRIAIEGLKDPKSLTAEQETLRNQIIADTVTFFENGMGVDTATQFPYDQITYDSVFHNPFPIKNTQPTSIGFYAQILGDAARGRTTIPGAATQADVLTRLDTLIDSIISAQGDGALNWNGLLPFYDLTGATAPLTSTVGLGDNANMAQSLAVMLGNLKGGLAAGDFTGNEAAVNTIITNAETVLDNMFVGFNAMYDWTTPVNGYFGFFRHSVDMNTSLFTGYVDRMSNEFRATIAFLVTYFGDSTRYPATNITQAGWDNLNSNLVAYSKDYTDSDGDPIPNAVPFHGGAFQMFWPLLRTNEENYVEITAMLQNFLYSTADFSADNNIPGFVSACLVPQPKVMPDPTFSWLYSGDVGVSALSEAIDNDEITIQNVGNLYSLISAFALNPNFVMNWVQVITDQFPQLQSDDYGFYDSLVSAMEIAESHYSIDQSTIVLALINKGGDDFDYFLEDLGLDDDFRDLYRGVDMELALTNKALPNPPTFFTNSLTVFNNIASEDETPTGTFPYDQTEETGAHFQYASQATDGGRFWILTETFDARASTLRVDYSVTTTPQEFKIVLRDDTYAVLDTYTVTVDASAGIHSAEFAIPNTAGFDKVARVDLIVEPTVTGVQTADFFVHQIQFRHLPLSGELAPDPSLGAGDITTLPNGPETNPLNGNGGTSDVTQPDTANITIDYDVSAQVDSFAGVMVHYDDFGTGGTVESEDLSSASSFVIGLRTDAAASAKVKIEVQDANGNKDSIILNGLTTTMNFYDIRLDYFYGIDWSKIASINLIVDQTLVTNNDDIIYVQTDGLA